MSGGTKSFNDFANKLNFYSNSSSTPAPAAPAATSASTTPSVFGFVNPFKPAESLQPVAQPAPAPDEESQGLLGMAQKGLGSVGGAFANMAGGARNAVTNATQRVQEVTISREQLMWFGILAGTGALFMFLAFISLPMLVVAPSKFALLFTVGSVCFIASFAALRGPVAFGKNFLSRERLPFSLAYASSLILTIWATMFAQSYILTLIFAAIQMVSLAYFLVSYLPGGTRALTFMGGMVWSLTARIFGGSGGGGSSLPI